MNLDTSFIIDAVAIIVLWIIAIKVNSLVQFEIRRSFNPNKARLFLFVMWIAVVALTIWIAT